MIIDNKLVLRKEKITVFNPYNNKKIGSVSIANAQDLNSAVKSAKEAFKLWQEVSPFKRYDLLFRVSQQLLKEEESFARLICTESGKPLKDCFYEVERAYQAILFSAEEAKRLTGEFLSCDVTPKFTGKNAFTMRRPLGVVLAITPFNFPLNLVVHKVAPAIAAGNSVILKPASSVPLTALKLCKLFVKCGMPKGLFNVVFLRGKETERLIKEDLEVVSFTGGVEVGKQIAQIAGMKKLILELGGNDPLVITKTANLDAGVDTAIEQGFGSNGQRCTAVKRLFLEECIADKFIEKLIKKSKKLKVGNPLDLKIDLGPVIDQQAADDIESRIKDALAKGGKLLLGNKRKGNIIYPTIIDYTPLNSRLIVDETFGPVLPVIRYKHLSQAIKIINSTVFGLQAGIYTNDLTEVKQFIKEVEAGAVIINGGPGFRIEHLPFGGTKLSGMGREGIKYAMQEMSEIKTVII